MAIGGLAGAAVGIVVAGVVAIVGVAVFLNVNTSQNVRQPLLDLVPLIIAATVIIGGLIYGLYSVGGSA